MAQLKRRARHTAHLVYHRSVILTNDVTLVETSPTLLCKLVWLYLLSP
jgi:hypothetical protein